MIVNIQTNASELAQGSLIAEQHNPGYVQGVWAITETREGNYMTVLCAPRKNYYEWLDFCDQGKVFESREDATAYILALPGISKELV